MSRIITRPEEIENNNEVYYVGNHYISLPEIDTKGSVISLNLISRSNKALLELKGKNYLFRPSFYKNGRELEVKKVDRKRKRHYLPQLIFYLESGIKVKSRLYTDLKEKGFAWDFKSTENLTIKLKTDINSVNLLRFNSHEIEFNKSVKTDSWLKAPILNIDSAQASLALAFGAEEDFTFNQSSGLLELVTGCNNNVNERGVKSCDNDVSYRNAFYIALNSDPDGASTTLIHLKRKGYKRIYQEFIGWLEKKAVSISNQSEIEDRLNQNLFFNYFFSVGKDIESDRYTAMTSRSPRYYVSGAFWERDSFLWSFPALEIVDKKLYKKVVREMILTHSKNAGDHAHYIDGTVLYPGFELDEAASYFILIEGLEQDFFDRQIMRALSQVLARIEEEYDSRTGLYKTFLLPSDDPARYPFVTIDNVMLWKGLKNFRQILLARGEVERANFLEKRIKGIAMGIKRYLVRKIDGKEMYLWSADGRGNYALYNDPPGNLGTMVYYGFVKKDDHLFSNTINYYYSSSYKYYFTDAAIEELACDHHPHTPSGLGLCGSLLNPLKRKEALTWLKKADMDYGLLAESLDRSTGEAKTGVGFATGAGYLAYVLYTIFK
jgi:hypothetical protein